MILSALASKLGLKPVWSMSSGDAGSDVNDWLAYALADSVQSAQLNALRVEVRSILSSNVPVTAKVMFDYYRALLDGNPPFPATVTPLFWMRGHDAPAFQDLAGSVSAAGVGDPVQRINNVSPLTAFWQSEAGSDRRDPTGFSLEPTDPNVGGYPLRFLSGSPGATINLSSSTLVVSWVQRYSDAFTLLIATGANPQWGVTATPLSAFINNSPVSLGFSTVMGARHTLGIVWANSGVTAQFWTNGVLSGTFSLAVSVTPGTPGGAELRLGHFQSIAYGSVGELIGVNRAVSSTELLQLMAYADSLAFTPAFPTGVPLLFATGDSNVVGVSSSQYDTYKFSILRALRATQNMEMVGAGVVGASASLDFSAIVQPYYSSSRLKHVCTFAAGANDIANGATGAATLAVAFATMDKLRAIGGGGRVKVLACALPDRNGLFSGQTHAGYRAEKAIFDAGIAASVGTHCDGYANWNTIPEVAADGAADNLTYFSADKVHINSAGQQKLQALMLAGVSALL